MRDWFYRSLLAVLIAGLFIWLGLLCTLYNGG